MSRNVEFRDCHPGITTRTAGMYTQRNTISSAPADDTPPFGTYALATWRRSLLHAAQGLPDSWLGRRTGLALRKLALSGGPPVIDADVEGLRGRFHTRDNVSERRYLFMPQSFDVYERRVLRESLQPGDTFADIGANAGIYSLTAAAAIGPTGRLLSVEPNPLMFERLVLNLSLNGFLDRAILEQAAVFDRTGPCDLALASGNHGCASLVNRRSNNTITVHCELLTDLLERHGIVRLDALKVDIEGAEDSALTPFFASAPVSLFPSLLIVEDSMDEWTSDFPATLAAAGYALERRTGMNLVYRRQS